MTTRTDALKQQIEPTLDAVNDAFDQATSAIDDLKRGPDAFLRLPFRAVDALIGGMPPGDIGMVGAFSGNGKTAFIMSLVDRLLQEGRTVYHLGLESRPNILRTYMACLRLGYHVGEILSGASRDWQNWPDIRKALVAEIERQRSLGKENHWLVDGRPAIDAEGLVEAAREAAYAGAHVVILDHVDHLLLSSDANVYRESRRAVQELKRVADDYGLRVIATTQLNNEAVKGDRLALYQPPQPHHVYMGGHKRHVSTWMLGLYRPISSAATADQLKAVRHGEAEPSTVLEPNTMGIVTMKHRYSVSHDGKRELLRVEKGRVTDLPERDRYTTSYHAEGPRP